MQSPINTLICGGVCLFIFGMAVAQRNYDSIAPPQEKSKHITQGNVALIQPIIHHWLSYYELDITKAHHTNTDTLILDIPEAGNWRTYAFTPDVDSDTIPSAIYSPDKQYYIDLGFGIEQVNGDKYFYPLDVDQSAFLIDRKRKVVVEFYFTGSSGHIEGVYWRNNDVFITCIEAGSKRRRFNVYDLKRKIISTFYIQSDSACSKKDYYRIFIENMGIKFHND